MESYNYNIKNVHVIRILNLLLYETGSFEFVSELIYQTRGYFEKKETHKETIISILNFVLDTEKIFVKVIDINNNVLVFDATNFKDLIKIINNNWSKFINYNNAELWYSYEISHTKLWKKELDRLQI